MEVVIVAIVSGIFSIVLALIGIYAGKKAGLGSTQDRLISDLKDTISIQDKRLSDQEKRMADQENKINMLQDKVNELGQLTIKQAAIIQKLISRRKITIQELEKMETS